MFEKLIKVGLIAILLNLNLQGQPFFNVGTGTNNAIYGMYGDNSTNILFVGGQFNQAGNIYCSAIAKWNGVIWDSTRNQIGNTVRAFERFNNEIYIVGNIAFIDSIGILRGYYIAKWDSINSLWTNFGISADESTYSLFKYNNELYVMGKFDSIANIYSPKIARYDGTTWYSFPPLDTVGGGSVITTAIFYNNELYVGGNFQSQQGPNMRDIAKWAGTQWQTVGGGLTGLSTWINSFVIYQGKLIAGGYFQTSSGDPGNGVAAWDGTSWSQLGTGVLPGQVFDMEVYNGELYVGGGIYDAGGVPVTFLAKWDGTQWHSLGITLDNVVLKMAVLGNDLYIGGGFWMMNNDSVNHIIRYNYLTGFESLHPINTLLEIIPNPSKDVCTITAKDINDASLIIYDITGRALVQQLFNSQATLNTSALTAGAYIVQVIDKEGRSLMGKMLKKN